MSLLTADTTVLIQGITGKEGQRALNWMLATGIRVAAGVTPGKGGETVEGVPVYDTVAQALAAHPEINLASIYVPPKFVLSAAQEAIAARIRLVHVIAEGVPTRDTALLIEQARAADVRLLGPSSIGLAVPGIGSVGSMGGGSMEDFLAAETGEGVAVIAKSGGMANTIAHTLTLAGIAQSLIIGIGGDRLVGTTYADLLPELERDPRTKAVVIIGEIGGSYEEDLAVAMQEQAFSKPVIAFISGLFAQTLPQGVAFGHAGAIVSKSVGTRQGKIDALQRAGAHIAHSPAEIVTILQSVA